MKKAVYRLILFAAITVFVLSLSPSVKAEPNDTQTKQTQCIASDTKTLCNADVQKPTPPKQPASDKETLPQKLEDEKSEANVYKDDVDNLKWAIKVIAGLVTAFVVFAFASMGIILFKNKKDYEHALADAKEAARDAKDAAKNARDLEKEARGILADIGKQAKTTLKEIDIKAQEKLESIDKLVADKLDEIEKTSRKQKEESSSEFERQRKISELFSKGLKADEAKDYETAAECFRQIVEEQKEENDQVAYNNWGVALANLAESKKGKEAEKFFKQAIEKYKRALEIKPDYSNAYSNWGDVLIEIAKTKKGPVVKDLLKQAEEKCLKAESIKTGEGAYNLACVYALRGNEDKCKEWLKVREKAETLPTRKYAMADDDLKSVRDKDWFKKLRWKGE